MGKLYQETKQKLTEFNKTSEIKISEHALIRYTQRVKRIKTKNVKRYLLHNFDDVAHSIVRNFRKSTHLAHGTLGLRYATNKTDFYLNGFVKYICRGNKIVTIARLGRKW